MKLTPNQAQLIDRARSNGGVVRITSTAMTDRTVRSLFKRGFIHYHSDNGAWVVSLAKSAVSEKSYLTPSDFEMTPMDCWINSRLRTGNDYTAMHDANTRTADTFKMVDFLRNGNPIKLAIRAALALREHLERADTDATDYQHEWIRIARKHNASPELMEDVYLFTQARDEAIEHVRRSIFNKTIGDMGLIQDVTYQAYNSADAWNLDERDMFILQQVVRKHFGL